LSYDENVEDALRLYRMLATIDSCPAPVVARVQGYALGGGSGLVCCTDVAVAAPAAVFGFSEVKLGIVPAVISPFVFPRIGTEPARPGGSPRLPRQAARRVEIRKLLVPNRGEIAIPVVRACAAEAIATVAVVAPDDEGSLHARRANEVVEIDNYLHSEEHIRAA